MPKKLKLTAGGGPGFSLIGIACHLKDYRMALLLNQKLHFRFYRIEDLLAGEPGAERQYAFFHHDHPDERRSYFLIENHHPEGRLIPEQKGVDYFLAIDDIPEPAVIERLLKSIKEIPQVMAVFAVDIAKVRNISLLLEEIELQFLEQKKIRRKLPS